MARRGQESNEGIESLTENFFQKALDLEKNFSYSLPIEHHSKARVGR